MDFHSTSSDIEDLQGVQRTLLIPLAARARAARLLPALDPQDRFAQAALEATGTEVHLSPADQTTLVNVLWRTGRIKQLGCDFFKRYTDSPGLDLGAGLAHHFQWLNNGCNSWVDVDLPEVIALRESLLHDDTAHSQQRSADLTQPGWWERLALPAGMRRKPLLLVCEGVLMYFQPSQARQILREIADNAPQDSELLVDFMSPLGMGQSLITNPCQTPHAPFQWGVHNGQEIASIHPRLELLAQHSVSEAYGPMASWTEMFWSPFTGGPLYGLAHLRVTDA